jgi:1-aminocyclopropane-1-carboxylate synthase
MIIDSPSKAAPPKLPHEQPNGMHQPGGIIFLSTENTSIMAKELSDFLTANMRVPRGILDNGVPPDMVNGSLLQMYTATPFTPMDPIAKENLFFVEGHSELLERIIWAICDEGEGVLASKPCDLRFIKTMGERCKVRPLLVNFDRVDPFSMQAVKIYENEALKAQANGIRVRVLMLSQPHCPPGRYALDFLSRHLNVDSMVEISSWST